MDLNTCHVIYGHKIIAKIGGGIRKVKKDKLLKGPCEFERWQYLQKEIDKEEKEAVVFFNLQMYGLKTLRLQKKY